MSVPGITIISFWPFRWEKPWGPSDGSGALAPGVAPGVGDSDGGGRRP